MATLSRLENGPAGPEAGQAAYQCPGQRYAITRAVHLGRMAAFFAACRRCPHQDDTGTLSPRRVRQLSETRPRGLSSLRLQEEGIGGVLFNDLGPPTAAKAAAAFGLCLQDPTTAPDDSTLAGRLSQPPRVVVGSDGRPRNGQLVAAVVEGLRWAGCHVVDLGPVSAPCLAFTIGKLPATGGLLVGNLGDRPQTAGLRFWGPRGEPFSTGGTLERIAQMLPRTLSRPTRTYGLLRRFAAEGPYLATLRKHYHALRPLQFVLESISRPVTRYLAALISTVACRVTTSREVFGRLGEQVVADGADFGIRIGDDGETAQLFDQRGQVVAPERLLLLVARRRLPEEHPWVVVLESGTADWAGEVLAAGGDRIERCDARRAQMAAALARHGAVIGGGQSGRIWYGHCCPPLPDALLTLTHLLAILSQSDRPLSEVLDAEVPWQ